MRRCGIRLLGYASFVGLFLAPSAYSQHADDMRGAVAHVHGVAQAVVELEGDLVRVELQSPMWNLVGFERAPANQVEADRWIAVANRLKASSAVVSFPDRAACEMQSAQLGPFAAAVGLAGALSASADADHAHNSSDEHEDHDAFHDAVLGWTFRCDDPGAVRSIRVALFDNFPRFEGVDVAVLSDRGPSLSARLTGDASDLAVR